MSITVPIADLPNPVASYDLAFLVSVSAAEQPGSSRNDRTSRTARCSW